MIRPLVAGNWKMNGLTAQAVELSRAIDEKLADCSAVEVVLCPPYTCLQSVREVVSRRNQLRLGAQNVHWEPAGAFTGEISTRMLRDLSCTYVIAGHSERRAHFGETDPVVRCKVRALLEAGLTPIVCVGETLDQRQAGQTEAVVRSQIEGCMHGLQLAPGALVVAYEPVWAIGSGKTATAVQAQEVHEMIRGALSAMSGREVGRSLRILYGGSLKPANAAELFRQPDVNGGLVGGASLDADAFVQIVRAAGSSLDP